MKAKAKSKKMPAMFGKKAKGGKMKPMKAAKGKMPMAKPGRGKSMKDMSVDEIEGKFGNQKIG